MWIDGVSEIDYEVELLESDEVGSYLKLIN